MDGVRDDDVMDGAIDQVSPLRRMIARTPWHAPQ